jgi:hypothetical protein
VSTEGVLFGEGGGLEGPVVRDVFSVLYLRLGDFVAMFLNRSEDVLTGCFCSFKRGDAYAT